MSYHNRNSNSRGLSNENENNDEHWNVNHDNDVINEQQRPRLSAIETFRLTTANYRSSSRYNRLNSNLNFRNQSLQSSQVNEMTITRRNNNNHQKSINQHLSPEQESIREILRNFCCPFNEDGNCRYIHRPEYCNFSHPNHAEESSYKRLPSFLCIFNLMKKCHYVVFGDKPRCSDGFHLDAHDLFNLEQFEIENQRAIVGFYYRYCVQECMICAEKICEKQFHKKRCWALHENCSHFACITCMRKWRERSHLCPMCRVQSDRYIWSNSHRIYDENHKKSLFENHGHRQIVKDPPISVPRAEPLNFDDVEIIYSIEPDGNIVYLDLPPEDEFDDLFG
ncbi:E3 ubiquitin-protein ligase makorin-1 [Dermatophagoides farinae]|uniref:E3 ubiquitin-protein ligase makorin-1 n=1 Tax=Dermatophagoides farinae TaxID=6954 RepID=A0A922L2L6_DERFA|nr:E3 ubiquitin-protein ligase makorin-1 [Dermatophagoides farinae]